MSDMMKDDLLQMLAMGIEHANSVVKNWSEGDLAGAVNGLEEWEKDAKALKLRACQPRTKKQERYFERAKKEYEQEGEIEIDSDAVVSESEDGAYVQGWLWVEK